MGRLSRIVSGRRSVWAVLAVWLVAVGAFGAPAGKFESAQKNDAASFLPGSAESVQVLDAAKRFRSGDATVASVVYRDPAGLTAADRRAIAAVSEHVDAAGLRGVVRPAPPVYSRDGSAALVTVPILANNDIDRITAAVDEIRSVIDRTGPPTLEAHVTGPAGFSADAAKVFQGINSTLLYATALLVFFLLVLIYRSPIFWFLPLLSVLFAESVVRGLGYLLAQAGVVINGQVGGLLLVLVFGAGTDYALLLTARYREELRLVEDKHAAMRIAVRRAGPAIVASAGTVVAALLCLSFARVNTTAGLGPVGAMGVAVAATAMLTLLPALLVLGGRRAFWPFVPRYGSEEASRRGAWRRLGERIERRHRAVWIITVLALGAMALGAFSLDDNLTSANGFRGSVEAVKGQQLLQRSFPAGASAPTTVLVRDRAQVNAAAAAARASGLVAAVGRPETGLPGARFSVTLKADPFSKRAFAAIGPLRDEIRASAPSALVGGPSAEEADVRAANEHDTRLLVPLVLAVVFAILVLLLRAVTAPLMLIATVVLSFFAAIGASLVILGAVTDFPGEDPSYALYSFIFLVALGVDYNIFLMARVREEAQRRPTRDAMLTALAVTGGVITSAGIVLAGTFAVLAVLPLVALTQVGFTVAFGVLLDTFVVRSILVPALTFELSERTWWPARLRRRRATAEARARRRVIP